jgi:hypothetical protein
MRQQLQIKNRTVKVQFVETDKTLNLKAIADVIANQIRKELTNNDTRTENEHINA